MANTQKYIAIHDLQEKLKYAYAVHIKALIPELMRNKCSGCEIDHPSQVKHICCMMDFDTQFELCFDEALMMLDEKKVLTLWEEIRPSVPEAWLIQSKLTDFNYRVYDLTHSSHFVHGVQAIIRDILMD